MLKTKVSSINLLHAIVSLLSCWKLKYSLLGHHAETHEIIIRFYNLLRYFDRTNSGAGMLRHVQNNSYRHEKLQSSQKTSAFYSLVQ